MTPLTRRFTGRLPRRTGLLVTTLAVGCSAVLGSAGPWAPAAHATPSVADARGQAATLRATVDRLSVAAERATEAYDAAQEKLGAATQTYLGAETDLDAARRRTSDQRTAAAVRVRALYESGGSAVLYATALDGATISDALDRVQLAATVIADSQSRARASGGVVSHLATLHARLGVLAARQDTLEQRAAAEARQVRALLDRQRALLAAADDRVRALVAAEQQARAAAAAQAFVAQLEAARAQAALAGEVVATDAPPTPLAAAAIAAARTRLGTPYVWGATGPDSFDCSGLTGWAYARAGLALPRTSRGQWYAGPHPSLAGLAPGDLLFWATDTSNPATIHHVALYIGGGWMIAAPHTGAAVQVQRVYLNGYIGAVRPGTSPGGSG